MYPLRVNGEAFFSTVCELAKLQQYSLVQANRGCGDSEEEARAQLENILQRDLNIADPQRQCIERIDSRQTALLRQGIQHCQHDLVQRDLGLYDLIVITDIQTGPDGQGIEKTQQADVRIGDALPSGNAQIDLASEHPADDRIQKG